VIHAVLLCDGDTDGDRIVAAVNEHLAPHQRIMRWTIWPGADFPRSATRKVRKEEVLKWLRSREIPAAERRAGTSALIRLLAELTRMDPARITETSRLDADLALDSLQRIELVSLIEETMNASIEESLITAGMTVADLETLIEDRRGRAPVTTPYPRWSLSPWAAALRPWALAVFFLSWLRPLCRVSVAGLEHLAGVRGPVLFMPTHRSFLDTPVIVRALPATFAQRLSVAAATTVLYRRFRWVVPLAELAFNSYPFATEAGENIKPSLEYTGRLVDDGWNVLIYPEGGMNRTQSPMQPLKLGAGMLAVEMQVPVIPVAVRGTERVLPPDTLVPRRSAPVTVTFGAPIHITRDTGYTQATQIIEGALRNLLN
jgi:long-chain acyl-CoA synthetase